MLLHTQLEVGERSDALLLLGLRPALEITHTLLGSMSIHSYSIMYMYMFILGCQTTYNHYAWILITMSVRHILLA